MQSFLPVIVFTMIKAHLNKSKQYIMNSIKRYPTRNSITCFIQLVWIYYLAVFICKLIT